MFVEIVRGFVVLLCTAIGFFAGQKVSGPDGDLETLLAYGTGIGALVGYVTGGVAGRVLERALGLVDEAIDRLPAQQVFAGLLGGGFGALLGGVLSVPILFIGNRAIALPIGGILIWFGWWVGFRIAARKSEQMFAAMGLSTRPLIRASAYGAGDGFVVDTSAVMDGQLLPLARAGLFEGGFLVPRFVLDELQGLADAPDQTRSRRAKRGLEALALIREEAPVKLQVLDDEVVGIDEVDAKVVALAKRLSLRILTNDGNLARVAAVQGVPVTNLRKLASELWPTVGPGDLAHVALVRAGKEPGQGVGFLDDGSMVVVNDGADMVGEAEIEVEVTTTVPTAMGRIIFARPTSNGHVGSPSASDVVANEGSAR